MTQHLLILGIVALVLLVILMRRRKFYPEESFEVFSRGDLEEASAQLDRDPRLLNGRARNGWTALHFAAWKNQSEMVRLLLSRGAHANALDKDNRIPLHFTESRIVARMLIEHGGAGIAKGTEDSAPRGIVLKFKDKESADLLKSHGAVQ